MIDLHYLRHLATWRSYQVYLEKLASDMDYQAQLTAEVKVWWAVLTAISGTFMKPKETMSSEVLTAGCRISRGI